MSLPPTADCHGHSWAGARDLGPARRSAVPLRQGLNVGELSRAGDRRTPRLLSILQRSSLGFVFLIMIKMRAMGPCRLERLRVVCSAGHELFAGSSDTWGRNSLRGNLRLRGIFPMRVCCALNLPVMAEEV